MFTNLQQQALEHNNNPQDTPSIHLTLDFPQMFQRGSRLVQDFLKDSVYQLDKEKGLNDFDLWDSNILGYTEL